jgi:hypothetical protein
MDGRELILRALEVNFMVPENLRSEAARWGLLRAAGLWSDGRDLHGHVGLINAADEALSLAASKINDGDLAAHFAQLPASTDRQRFVDHIANEVYEPPLPGDSAVSADDLKMMAATLVDRIDEYVAMHPYGE